MISKTIVFVYLPGEFDAVPAGTLTLIEVGSSIRSNFVYGSRYMNRPNAIELDPVSLTFHSVARKPEEEIIPPNDLPLFGVFRDATPDAWGRRVIEKQFKAPQLPEIEYIKHSFDDRVGALDFRDTPLSASNAHPFNRVLDLQYLIDCADKIDNDEPVPDDILQMFNYGSSMGGARPKAVVEDHSGLWLAKFRARNDKFDYAKVEAATLLLAQACGIDVPEVRTEVIGNSTVFLIKRFDREKTDQGYRRVHFLSALTLLGKDDDALQGVSYAEIIAALIKHGPSESAKMKLELFRRMVFNILVSNTDDHLRNHGFVYSGGRYTLSKAYDIVPAPTVAKVRFQQLNVGAQGRLSTLDNALSQCGLFGLARDDAIDVLRNMVDIVGTWREFFASHGVLARDIVLLELAFRHPEQLGFRL
jgi:serine/threonine-protein kinase HipA